MNDDFNFSEIARVMPLINEDSEFFPIISPEDADAMDNTPTPDEISILPLRNTVLFPGVVLPITVGRDKSIKLVKEAYQKDKTIGVVAQKDSGMDDPTFDDLNTVGTIATIFKILQMPDGSTTIIIQGKKRFALLEETQSEPYMRAKIAQFDEIRPEYSPEFEAMIDSIRDLATQIIKQSPNIPSESAITIKNIESVSFLINFISSNMDAEVSLKQKMLEMPQLKERAQMVLERLMQNLQSLELKNLIQSKVRTDIDKQQREYFLNQQLKTIQEELGGKTPDMEVENLRERAKDKKWTEEIKDAFEKELAKLNRTNPMSPDYSVQINYLELLLDLPWGEFSEDNFDLKHAKEVLEEEHFGIEKVKKRIIEYLAVLKLKKDLKAPILCLVGPPGVGKTSLGKSIAQALNRKYARIALGGLRDEAEIRGHRKTYIGAMPGRIIQSLKRAGTSNPVFILDEIDKVGNDFRGDPSSALLEVLDPEQNATFVDNYVELEYDLSKVLFIATANSLATVHPALLDRMEIIEVNGYTIEEKVQIAKQYLVKKQKEAHGLEEKDLQLSDEILEKVVEGYTRESGVRTLDKQIGALSRGVAAKVAMEESYNPQIDKAELEDILGIPRYDKDMYENNIVAGVVTGLAWTQVGGDILYIEASLSKGKGILTITGNLGEVMKESATIALAYIKANAEALGISNKALESHNIHIHVPAGAIPKDGPSAGITMLTALTSALLDKRVKPHLAMTGEITLRGKVLPVGGIKEKILAAKRANIKEIILCKDNQKDISEIKQDYIKDMTFHYVSEMQEVLKIALK